MDKKIHSRLLAVASLGLLLCSSEVFAQDGLEGIPDKPDLSHPETLSIPPMDLFSLSYRPERPQDALDIENESQCKANRGKWGTGNHTFDWGRVFVTGCTIDGKRQGLWRMSEEKINAAQMDDAHALGYMWMVNDEITGWLVKLHEPLETVHILSQYEHNKRNGAAFGWDPIGSLVIAERYKDDVLDGPYETYLDSLPTAIGAYTLGKPSGIWKIYEEPGMISLRRDYSRKASKEELPSNTPPGAEAYWTEWFNGEGVRIVEGYSISEHPTDSGIRVGNMRFYAGSGNLWLDVMYGGTGQINDQMVFDVCKPYGVPDAPIPAFLDFNHNSLELMCSDKRKQVYQVVKYYPEGQIWQIMSMRDARRHGVFREFHPSGEVLAQYSFQDDVPEGEIRYLDTSGETMGEATSVVHGNGLYVAYWHNGNKREEGQYRMGVKSGKWWTWYTNGTNETETDYRMGIQDGVERSWFKNGVVGGERYYKNGSREGVYFGNFSDGRMSFKYEFRNDRIINKVYQYTHDGFVESETDYSKSSSSPYPRTYFYNDGKPKASGMIIPGFGEGVRTGVWDFFLRDGTKWYSVTYDGGEPLLEAAQVCELVQGEFKIDEENHEIGCISYLVNRETPLARVKRREGYWEWYNEQGRLEKSGSLKLGHLNGVWHYYYVNGKPMLTGSYLIDKRVGKWTGYYEDGERKFDGVYEDGLESGYWKTFHPVTGEVSSEGEFVSGKRHGKWVWRYSNGKLREEGRYEHGIEVGTWTQYHENGKKLGEGEYIDGKREGEWTWWRDNGSVWRKAVFEKGREKQ